MKQAVCIRGGMTCLSVVFNYIRYNGRSIISHEYRLLPRYLVMCVSDATRTRILIRVQIVHNVALKSRLNKTQLAIYSDRL